MSALLKKIQQDLNLGAVANPQKFRDIQNQFRTSVSGMNDFVIQSVRAKSATQAFTEALIKQEVGFGKWIRSRQMFNEVLKEQYQLQRMTAVQYSRDVAGNVTADVIVPKGVPERIDQMASSWKANAQALIASRGNQVAWNEAMDMAKMRIGLFNQLLGSSATKMINWGKNTQWAGRQLTVGLSVPLAAFAALAGKAAYDADKQLTRILKVYDFSTKGPAQAAEAQKLYNDSLQNGIQLAKMYGSSLNDTLDVEAQLAATGLKGNELLQATNQVQRASILGEMDKQDTIKATIALQATLHHNAAQLANDFNYMNAIENATNLTMQDFVAAIPRALGPLSQLGVSLQDMGLLLATMKSRGVDAAQGANALKSGMNRVLNPTKAVVTMLDQYNINLQEIVKSSGGNFLKVLEVLSDKMKDFNNLQRAQIIGKLFGTYQFSRVNAIIQGLQDIHDKAAQVGRAYQVSAQNTAQWGQVAQQEIQRVQQSASGKFHIAIASLQASFASLGKPFLEAATTIVHGITGIIDHLNKMPHAFKYIAMLGILVTAAIGPLIMLAGLIPNLIGNGLRMLHWVLDLGNGFKAMTAQERAAQMLGEQHSYVWKNEANAAQALAGTVAELTRNFQLLAYEERAARMGWQAGPKTFANGMVGPNLVPVGYGEYQRDRPGGPFASQSEIAAYKEMAAETDKVAEESAVVQRNWSGIAMKATGFAAAASTGLMLMQGGTNKLLNTVTNVLLVTSLIGPAVLKSFKTLKEMEIFSTISTAFSAGKAEGGIVAGIKAAMPALETMGLTVGRIFGPVGILAGGALLFYKAWQNQKKIEEEQTRINDTSKDWSSILGYVYQDYRKINSEASKNPETVIDQMAKKLKDSNPDFVNYLQHLKDVNNQSAIINRAIQAGLDTVSSGGDASQARTAVEVTFRAAGYHDQDLNDLMKKVMARVNFGSDSSVIDNANKQFANMWSAALSMNNDGGALAAIKSWVGTFNRIYSSASPQVRLEMFNNLKNDILNSEDKFFSTLPKDVKAQMKKYGYNSMEDLVSAYLSGSKQDNQNLYNLRTDGLDWSKFKRLAEGEQTAARAIADFNGVSNTNIKQIHTMADLIRFLPQPLNTVKQAQMQYTDVIQNQTATHAHLSKAVELNLLNYYRLSAGLPKATSLEQGFGDAVDSNTKKLDSNTQAARINSDVFNQLTSTMKGAYQNAQQAAVSAADNIWNEATQAQTTSMQKSQKVQDASFSAQEKAITKRYAAEKAAIKESYAGRIKALQAEINAENAAEKRRQEIFQAEQDRLQRLADMANNAIDFNVALNSGNLDEAAKIINTMQSTQDQNAISDAAKNDQTASQKRLDALNKEKDAITKLRDARLKALEKEEAAEKAALERRKKRYDDEAAAKQQMLQQELNMRKAYLDLEVQAITANIPTTKAEYENQIHQIEAAYKAYGVDLQGYGDQWGGYVGQALNENIKAAANGLKSDINWQHIAYKVAEEFARGAFGLSLTDFAKWISTGKLPKGGIHPQDSKSGGGAPQHGAHHIGGFHTGGSVTDLRGHSPSTGLFKDERLIRAQVGEYVINRDAASALGADTLNRLNAIGRHSGGPIGPAGIAMGMLGGMMSGTVTAMMAQAAKGRMAGGSLAGLLGGVPNVGNFSGINNDALRNAAIIVAVGRAMGATSRDEITALAVSLVESGLHNINYGDRDSLGLFQQRPSQGWGTPAQIMNPRYAAHAFYAALMRYPQRGQWPIGKAAQIVQRSAYPEIYYGMVPKARSIYGEVLPQLFTGGTIRYNNTIANLHKDEKVLTAPLSKSLERGIENLERGYGDHYDMTFDFRGATIKDDVDIERAIDKALAKRDGKRGRSRKIGDFNL